METIRFYNPKGEPFDEKAFIDFYSNCYYLTNSKYVEDRIEALLNADSLSPEDVMLILRWKLGRIDHKKSQSMNKIVFRGNENGSITQTERGKKVNAAKLCETIAAKYTDWKNSYDYQSILMELRDNSPENIGTVYLLTLLYFITGGELPIYDRFAMMAARAIIGDEFRGSRKPGAVIEYKEPPAKKDGGFGSLINSDRSQYREYIRILKQIFGEEYKTDRNIDRALWVYGHCFRDKEY